MVLLEPCTACGSHNLAVEIKGGLRFLVCEHCKSTMALLDDKPMEPYMLRSDFVTSTGVMMSGYMPKTERITMSGYIPKAERITI